MIPSTSADRTMGLNISVAFRLGPEKCFPSSESEDCIEPDSPSIDEVV